MTWVFVGSVAVAAGLAYIRLAPSDLTRWHVVPEVSQDRDLPGGVMRRVPGGIGDFAALDRIARETPRTQVLAGSVAEGRVTYITRSRVFGFPDYTTIAGVGDDLVIWARLRFGRSDLGVNKARVEGWLAQVGAS